jgi:hypothetical protein
MLGAKHTWRQNGIHLANALRTTRSTSTRRSVYLSGKALVFGLANPRLHRLRNFKQISASCAGAFARLMRPDEPVGITAVSQVRITKVDNFGLPPQGALALALYCACEGCASIPDKPRGQRLVTTRGHRRATGLLLPLWYSRHSRREPIRAEFGLVAR